MRLTTVLTLSLLIFTSDITASLVETTHSIAAFAQANQNSNGRPKRRKPGGRKGICQGNRSPGELTAIIPEQGADITASHSPAFFFFIPDAAQSSLKGVFRLQENDRNVIAPIRVSVSGTPGIIKIQLPQSLEKNRSYQWLFQITCGDEKAVAINGTITFREPSPSLTKQLTNQISAREKARLYQREGFFLDAIALLAEAQIKDTNAKTDWKALLQILGLPELTQQPIVPCCTPTTTYSQFPSKIKGDQ
ncbi:DUF928 domain-containing protein [Phormidesmis priestleyi]